MTITCNTKIPYFPFTNPFKIHLPGLKQATKPFHYEIQSLTCFSITYKVATVQQLVCSEHSKKWWLVCCFSFQPRLTWQQFQTLIC